MIALLITWIPGEATAINLTGVQLDLVQFIYDVLLAFFLSLAVWKITLNWDEQRQIRKSFRADVQNLSRYLTALQKLVEAYPMRKCDLEIEQLIALSPRHESFDYLEDGYEMLWELAEEERSILESISATAIEDLTFKRHGVNLCSLRNRVIRLRLPSGKLKSQFNDRLMEQIEMSQHV